MMAMMKAMTILRKVNKMIDIINEQHERLYKEHLKANKRQIKRERVMTIIYTTLFVTLLIGLVMVVRNDTKKAIQHCVDNGNSYEYCVMETSK